MIVEIIVKLEIRFDELRKTHMKVIVGICCFAHNGQYFQDAM